LSEAINFTYLLDIPYEGFEPRSDIYELLLCALNIVY